MSVFSLISYVSRRREENMETYRMDEDALYKEAMEYACSQENMSISMLQRKYRIGFRLAERLMDRLVDDGIVSCEAGTIPKVLGKSGNPKREIVDRWKQLGTGFDKHYNNIIRIIIESCCADSEANSIFSPLSVLVLVNMLAGATVGKTRHELETIIGKNLKYDSSKEQIKTLLSYLGTGDCLQSANAACIDLQIRDSINPEYIKELQDYYSAELISSNNIALDTNKWVSEKTKGAIQKVLQNTDKNLVASLINAIAFDAKWQETYGEDNVLDGRFTNSDSSISIIPMLHSGENKYIEGDKYVGFIKNYKRGEFSFMGLLPKKKGAENLRRCLKQLDFTEAFASAVREKVLVKMPEFNYSCKIDVKELCKQLGAKEVFTSDADFSPMSSEWLMIDNMLHSARIEVDRKGTKAAAVTVAAVGYGCTPDFSEPKIVELNRPFIYAIMHNATKLPIFVGIVNKL